MDEGNVVYMQRGFIRPQEQQNDVTHGVKVEWDNWGGGLPVPYSLSFPHGLLHKREE